MTIAVAISNCAAAAVAVALVATGHSWLALAPLLLFLLPSEKRP